MIPTISAWSDPTPTCFICETSDLGGLKWDMGAMFIPDICSTSTPAFQGRGLTWYSTTESSLLQVYIHYSSSLAPEPGSCTSSQAAGVPTSILYTHFSDSDTRQSSSVSAHASQTSVLLFGPFQQP